MTAWTRRRVLGALALGGGLAPLAARASKHEAGPKVVVIGGGFGGATCARYLKLLAPGFDVTLLEPTPRQVCCPFSNSVLGGLRSLAEVTVGRDALGTRHGVRVLPLAAEALDVERREVRAGNSRFAYDRLIVAPGIGLRWGSPEGYDRAAALRMPHAWRAGPQTARLAAQVANLPDGGVVAISVPRGPFRCPPGPYERASLIANALWRSGRRRAKVLILDANETFSKQALFEQGWAALYPGLIEHVPLSQDGEVVRVDARALRLHTEFAEHAVDVANVIPAQAAARIASDAGLTDASGWCPVRAESFESALVPGVHVIGDAALASPMPKSASAANSQAKLAALAVIASLTEAPVPPASLHNTCYSLLAADYAISINGIYRVANGAIVPMEGAGGVSPLAADGEFRRAEADYATGWFESIVADSFG